MADSKSSPASSHDAASSTYGVTSRRATGRRNAAAAKSCNSLREACFGFGGARRSVGSSGLGIGWLR